MSKETNIEDEQIIAFLLGDLDKEQESLVKNALVGDTKLQEKEKIFADTLRLLDQSCKESIHPITGEDWKLSESQKDKIFAIETPDLKESKNDLNDHSTDTKQSRNLLFWIPLGVAACAFFIVMVSGPKKQNQLQVAVQKESERISIRSLEAPKEDLNTKEELGGLSEDTELKQLLNNQAQEGINRELIARTTGDVLAMNEELKKVPLTAGEFAINESRPVPMNSRGFKQSEYLGDEFNNDRSVTPEKTKSKKNILFPGSKITTDSITQDNLRSNPSVVPMNRAEAKTAINSKSDLEVENLKNSKENFVPKLKFEYSAIAKDKQLKDLPVAEMAETEVEFALNSSKSSLGVIAQKDLSDNKPEQQLRLGSSLPLKKASELDSASKTQDIENIQTMIKKNGYDRIDLSKSVHLFTPKAKALGKVKIVSRTNQMIELLRLHETRLGKSALLSGEDYQLRFSSDNEPVIILVGSLNKKDEVKENLSNLHELSTYFFEIKEAWELDEKEIRKPYNLNTPR